MHDIVAPRRVDLVMLDKPLKVFGKILMTRGVYDSTTFFGFYNPPRGSLRKNELQTDRLSESVVGNYIQNPS